MLHSVRFVFFPFHKSVCFFGGHEGDIFLFLKLNKHLPLLPRPTIEERYGRRVSKSKNARLASFRATFVSSLMASLYM